ncbi:MAG: hypothetical protein K6F09_01155 [Clostridiales bacterium]|nr:hypothetical protein [Clostridiales bacterium]
MELSKIKTLPRRIFSGEWSEGHVQGIAVDRDGKYIYFSFTTVLVKTDMSGHLIGTVTGLTGHLGCITYNSADGRVYGSIEYKHDAIGLDIEKQTGRKLAAEDAFYVGIFDVEKISRVGMDAEKDGIMTAAYLPDAAEDYGFINPDGTKHRYACSGIDGVGFGPVFGSPDGSPYKLFVAYGIYNDTKRTDNDNQVLLQLDPEKVVSAALPLSQDAPHHSAVRAEERYFVYTGNTDWGVQNIEYDPFLNAWLVAVYPGSKKEFKNYPMYLLDCSVPARSRQLPGLDETGLMPEFLKIGRYDKKHGIYGCDFPLGSTGMASLGNGCYYFSIQGTTKDCMHTSTVEMYRYSETSPDIFVVSDQDL